MKKALRVTQTQLAGCSKTESKQTPFKGAERPKSNQLVTTFTYKPSLVRIDARNFELHRGNRPTHPHTPTHRQDQLQYTALQLERSVINLLLPLQQSVFV